MDLRGRSCTVIWATQVLETLAKDGIASRAEITDAAMSERAECVMLNKGPHIQRSRARQIRHFGEGRKGGECGLKRRTGYFIL
jgi:hypothetical protein